MRRPLIAALLLMALSACAAAPTATEATATLTAPVAVTLAPTRPPTLPPSPTSPNTSPPVTTAQPSPTPSRTATPAVVLPAAGSILREYWFSLPGYDVADLTGDPRYPAQPDYCDQGTELATTPDQGDDFGARLRGFLLPPLAGAYTFWISSDNTSELWLSADSDPANLARIAQVTGYTNYLDFDALEEQRSIVITLRARQAYALEVLFKEDGFGFDHVSVAWQGPGLERQVISSAYLSSQGLPCQRSAPPTTTPPG